jgi:hypothetical protein
MMASTSTCRKNSRSLASIQLADVSSISSLTNCGGLALIEVIGHILLSRGIQLPDQIFIVLPFPT